MNLYLNLILIGLLVVITTKAQDDEARCADLEAEGKIIIESCDKQFDKEKPVPLLKCYWKGLKKIPIVADLVIECEKIHPDDDQELFCGLEVLMCSVEKLSKVCEPYIENRRKTNDNASDKDAGDSSE